MIEYYIDGLIWPKWFLGECSNAESFARWFFTFQTKPLCIYLLFISVVKIWMESISELVPSQYSKINTWVMKIFYRWSLNPSTGISTCTKMPAIYGWSSDPEDGQSGLKPPTILTNVEASTEKISWPSLLSQHCSWFYVQYVFQLLLQWTNAISLFLHESLRVSINTLQAK